MYYHASQIKGIKELEPRVSNHNIPLIYFSIKRENVLVYLSNAVEKFCKDTDFKHRGVYSKWGTYSFTEDGKIQLEEYYPNATIETYKGISAYIYHVKEVPGVEALENIPYAFKTSLPTPVDSVEYIQDAYDAIIEEVNKGNMILVRYKKFIKTKKEWLEKTIRREYEEAVDHPEYQYFLKNKFDFLKNDYDK